MTPIQFQVSITLDSEAVATLVTAMRQLLKEANGNDEAREARLRASRQALFSGQTPPTDKGLLIDSREAAKLLNVSTRKLWAMWNDGRMPKPIRIGHAIRFSYEELQAWVNAGGPPHDEWEWPKR